LELERLVSWIWGFLAWTGLTCVLYRPDRYRSLSMEIIKSFSDDPAWGLGSSGVSGEWQVILWLSPGDPVA
jgi:hypothetical protein